MLGDKRRGRLEMRRELVSEWGAPGRAGGDAPPAGRPRTALAPAPRRPPRAWLVPALAGGQAGGGGGAPAGRAHPGRRSEVPCSTSAVLLRRSASAA